MPATTIPRPAPKNIPTIKPVQHIHLSVAEEGLFKLLVFIIGKIQRGLKRGSRNPTAMTLWPARVDSKL
jgi:hypothetical protein